MDIVTELIKHIVNTQFEDLPHDVIEEEKKFIIDSLGVAIAGSSAPGCKEIVDLIKEWGGKPEATIIAYGDKVASPWAAFANSTMMHALDFDDTLDESALHAHVSVLPTALAMAELRGGVTGKEFINAVVLGVDLVCRLGLATRRPLSWIRTSTCGSFGSAATAAKVLSFDNEKMLRALGIVYSQTSGNAQCLIDGGLVKRMQPAFSAQAGVISALLAHKGITGPRDILEGSYGFFNLYEGGDYDREKILTGLGKQFEGTKLSIKPYPSCRMTHASIDAAIAVRKENGLEASEIEEIVVYVSKMVYDMVGSPFAIRKSPQVDAQFSIPYTVAAGILRGDVFLKDFEEVFIRDPQALKLAEKVKVIMDPGLPERDMSAVTLVVKTRQNVYGKKVNKVKGSPSNPMSTDECIEKFKKCLSYRRKPISQGKLDEILDGLVNLELIKDIKALTNFFNEVPCVE
jgi:2-methylcitrate dehydratase PrpD